MALDGITIANTAYELNTLLTGARISRIAQPENNELLLTFKTEGRTTVRLLMSADPSLPLIYITDVNKPSPAVAPNFCMLLRKHVGNGRILSVTQPSLERILRFDIEHYDEMGDLRRKVLVLELMGKHSNIIFCDDAGMIIDSIKHISAQTSSVREVLPGRTYFIPETQHKLDPLETTEEEFAAAVFTKGMPLSSAIYTAYTGISPVIAEEVCCRASLDNDRSAIALSDLEQKHIYRQFSLMMEDVREKRFSPQIYFNDKDEPVEFSSLPLTTYSDLRSESHESISYVLEQYYRLRNSVTRMRQKSSDLRRIAATAADRAARKLQLQDKQLKDTEKRDKYRLWGELLHTYGYEAEPGAKELKVINYYDGTEIAIPLDPTLTAAENAKRYYDRYGKLKRTYEALTVQIAETKADLDHLESIQTFLDMAVSEDDLAQVREELTEAGYIRRKGPAGKKKKITSEPYHYLTPDGYDVYVGKNNFQNDELTFRFASGSDWWFHAKGAPGSHVILKNKGVPVPDTAFEDAARLAAYYSKNRANGKVEIDYVQKKEVKKPAGAKPGFVVYYTNYSMVIDTDISRLTLV